jgi:hypothetical protein
MDTYIVRASVTVFDRPEGYREFRCIPAHWVYEPPFDRQALYAEGVSNNLDLHKDWDFWSASDAALRLQRVPAEQLDIHEMVVLATRRAVDYNAPKPWAARTWVDEIDAEWAQRATHLHPFARLPESEQHDLWSHGGMNALPISSRLEYPLQTGVGILPSERPYRSHEPWHGGEGLWYRWEALDTWNRWPRRQEAEWIGAAPQDAELMLFVSHRWETLDHPDPTGRQLQAVRTGLTLALAAGVLSDADSTPSGLPELFRRYLDGRHLATTALRAWAEHVRHAAMATFSETEFLQQLEEPEDTDARQQLAFIRKNVLLWYDYTSMYQTPRDRHEEEIFRVDLTRLNDIQAGAATLVLGENEDYTRRAWCFLEISGGVRGLLVELTPSWGKSIGAYHGVQRWSDVSDQLIGALITHGERAIEGSGLQATHASDLPIVAGLIARLPLFGLVSSSGSDLIGGSIPMPRRNGAWILDGRRATPDVRRDGPAVEFGAVPPATVLELVRVSMASADGLDGSVGMWVYTSQRVLSLAWASRAPEWTALAGVGGPVASVACTWADARALAEDGRGWTRYVPSRLETLIVVTQTDLNRICRLLDQVIKAHLTAGTTVITVMPDSGRVSVERPDVDREPPEGVDLDVLAAPRIRRYTAYPRYLTRAKEGGLDAARVQATLRLDPSGDYVPWGSTHDLDDVGARRVAAEATARLTTASWEVYAIPRLDPAAWRNVDGALAQVDAIIGLVQRAASVSSNPFECRGLIYGFLEQQHLMGSEPLTQDVLDALDAILEGAEPPNPEESAG